MSTAEIENKKNKKIEIEIEKKKMYFQGGGVESPVMNVPSVDR